MKNARQREATQSVSQSVRTDADGIARLDALVARHRSSGGAVLAASHGPLGGSWAGIDLGATKILAVVPAAIAQCSSRRSNLRADMSAGIMSNP